MAFPPVLFRKSWETDVDNECPRFINLVYWVHSIIIYDQHERIPMGTQIIIITGLNNTNF